MRFLSAHAGRCAPRAWGGLALVLMLGWWTPPALWAGGDSLAEAARKEKLRRTKNEKTGLRAEKFTDEHIQKDEPDKAREPSEPRSEQGVFEVSFPGSPRSTGPWRRTTSVRQGAIPGSIEGPDDARERQRDDVQRSVRNLRRRVAEAQSKLDSVKNRWNPPGYAAGIQCAVGRAEEKLRQAEKDLENYLEAARRRGVPPGWLR